MVSGLFRRSEQPPEWKQYFADFAATGGSADFPCIFAPAAYRRDQLLFGAGHVGEQGWQVVVELMDLAAEAVWTNPDQVIVLWLEGIESGSLEEDHAALHNIFTELLRADSGAWPEDAPVDPASPDWNFWYRGIDFFVNANSRHHIHRRSHNLGSCFTLVVQSRASFDRLPDHAESARTLIRQRLADYDTVEVSPFLGTHGKAPELPQFFLGDTNTCPYMAIAHDDITALRNEAH